MRPSAHIIVSLGLGTIVWLYTKSLYVTFIGILSGVISDIDHIIEYIIHFSCKNLSLKQVFLMCEHISKKEGRYFPKKLYIIFHGGEIAIILWVISFYTKNLFLLIFALGYSLHITLDSLGNNVHPRTYLISWRIVNKFDIAKMLKK